MGWMGLRRLTLLSCPRPPDLYIVGSANRRIWGSDAFLIGPIQEKSMELLSTSSQQLVATLPLLINIFPKLIGYPLVDEITIPGVGDPVLLKSSFRNPT